MNKNFLEHYMKTKPDTNEQKYLFLVDNQEMAFAIDEVSDIAYDKAVCNLRRPPVGDALTSGRSAL